MIKNHPTKNKDLFLTFFKIGAFTFGGGYAMIPIIEREIVEKKKWLKHDDIMEVVAIAETTPGPIAINSATFVGYRVSGFFGALVATLGVTLPSFAIILIIASFFQHFKDYTVVNNAFWGIRIGILALLGKAFLSMFIRCPKHLLAYGIALLSFLAVAFADINAILIILIAAIIGITYQIVFIRSKVGENK